MDIALGVQRHAGDDVAVVGDGVGRAAAEVVPDRPDPDVIIAVEGPRELQGLADRRQDSAGLDIPGIELQCGLETVDRLAVPQDRLDAAQASNKEGEWNELEIQCVGPSIKTWLNDNLVVDMFDSFDETLNIIAFRDTEPIGTIRVVMDSPAGFPAEKTNLRRGQ